MQRLAAQAVSLEQIPINAIDEYSESTSGRFEPREDRKGDIARAIFYFYTMYKSQADVQDNSFFSRQKSYICQWQAMDPVSQVEIERSQAIAESPQGNENPFVLDSSLADRAYCSS